MPTFDVELTRRVSQYDLVTVKVEAPTREEADRLALHLDEDELTELFEEQGERQTDEYIADAWELDPDYLMTHYGRMTDAPKGTD